MEKINVDFERNLSGSFMKIAAPEAGSFDERMLLKQKIPGLLPIEKSYINGIGQYWYQISGKQSLDTFCKIKPVGEAFLEQMLHSICEELRLLEQHLMNINGLCLDTELIYISNTTQEFLFTFLPGFTEELQTSFRELMENILSKIDHKDAAAVALAYEIYEKTLDEGYSIEEIHASIVRARVEKVEPMEETLLPEEILLPKPFENEARDKTDVIDRLKQFMRNLLSEWFKAVRAHLPFIKQKGKSDDLQIIYPDDEEEEIHEILHPTICLTDYREHPEGILLYEGYENFENIRLEEKSAKIGQGDEMDVTIKKDTISRIHARIAYEDKEYFLEDLNSTNGTFVNDEPLPYKQRRKLKSNDIIRFADVKYRFV